ncbi:hypothetical protein [Vreelandella gomseomensis]|uniref:Uncharacterized protein n=1 Tax=Vreelandella gomseomensis TaxID=370766 RepID=A0ABU1GEM8_9GAMM|nr:hypothetical protein [Halomonas gomseomensis]MDR5875558.1 hypothetical protein [Halomonas gomseomensis]
MALPEDSTKGEYAIQFHFMEMFSIKWVSGRKDQAAKVMLGRMPRALAPAALSVGKVNPPG